MVDLSMAVDTLINVLQSGGASAAKDLIKGAVYKGAEAVSKLWHTIFDDKPEAYPLAIKVAQERENSDAQRALRTMLEEYLSQHPQVLQQLQQKSIQVGNVGGITADQSSVAAAVISHSTIKINNK